MKKVFMILGICLMASLVVFTSCKKTTTPSKDKEEEKKPEPEPEPEPEAVIVIDGEFADWTAAGADAAVSILPEEATKLSVLVLKAIADEENIYVYFEQELEEGQVESPFDLFINADNNTETGASCYLWPEGCGWDYLIESEEGLLGSATTIRDMVDMNVYHFFGPDGEDGWAEEGAYQEKLDDISDFTVNAGVVTNGVAKVELAISRAAFGNKFGKTIAIGILLYDGPEWNDNGYLPQDGEGMLEVKLP